MSVLFASLLAVLFIPDAEIAEEITVAREIVENEDTGRDGSVAMIEEVGGAEALKIFSERCDFDRTDGVVLFEGSVALEYSSGYTMNADRLFVFFEGTNTLDSIVAEGNVVFTNDTRVGQCERAVYRRAASELELFGGPNGALARLAELGQDEIAGRRIVLFAETEQVEVFGSELTFERGGSSTNGTSKIERKFRRKHRAKREAPNE